MGNRSRDTASIDWYSTAYDTSTDRLFLFVRALAASRLGTVQYLSTNRGATWSSGEPLVLQGGSRGFSLVTP